MFPIFFFFCCCLIVVEKTAQGLCPYNILARVFSQLFSMRGESLWHQAAPQRKGCAQCLFSESFFVTLGPSSWKSLNYSERRWWCQNRSCSFSWPKRLSPVYFLFSSLCHVTYPHPPCSYVPMANNKQTQRNLQRGSVDHSAAFQDITVIETRVLCISGPQKY